MQAMILAAGFGTRLLPHTLGKPKPLFPVLNEPLLLLTIRRLQRSGFDHIIVNCHHLREQIVRLLQGVAGVIVQEEEHILGTGGGLRRALPLLRDEPLLITNGDIYHTIDYGRLWAAHAEGSAPVTLAMHNYPRFNTVRVTAGRVTHFETIGSEGENLAFTGLSVIDPVILSPIEDGRQSCIIDHYRKLLRQGQVFDVHRVDDCFWTDMGTERDYLELHEGLLHGTIPRWQEFSLSEADLPLLVDRKAQLTGTTALNDWCAIGGATGHDVSLARVVVWDGVRLPNGYCCEDAVLSVSPAAAGGEGIEPGVLS